MFPRTAENHSVGKLANKQSGGRPKGLFVKNSQVSHVLGSSRASLIGPCKKIKNGYYCSRNNYALV